MRRDSEVAAADAPGGTGPTVAELLEESAALTKALTGLTCNGSEFFIRKGDRYVADINACVSWVRRVKADAHRMTVDAIISRKAAEARAAELLDALRTLNSTIGGYMLTKGEQRAQYHAQLKNEVADKVRAALAKAEGRDA